MRTGILVHGCNLNIENWRHVAWGDPPAEPGRIPQGILIAAQMQAEKIVFGTGASRKAYRLGTGNTDLNRVLLEAEYSLEYLRQNFDRLRDFSAFAGLLEPSNSWTDFQQSILNKIILDVESQNTVQEIETAAELFLNAGIERIILVSSPTHIVRCLRDATALFMADDRFAKFRTSLLASPSVTCYEGTTPSDVVVVEPPHRPDRHVIPTHRRIQRMLTLQKLNQPDLVSLIEEFDDLLQRYEHRFFSSSD